MNHSSIHQSDRSVSTLPRSRFPSPYLPSSLDPFIVKTPVNARGSLYRSGVEILEYLAQAKISHTEPGTPVIYLAGCHFRHFDVFIV
ncbi:hypothetical protein VTL71DRAFT_8782 [Oculimacula yallundae]|uniref:Uncharacterized protein n=1 Tax=Oculimacula yallundae TaxID=86028 RepID=A0ABR4CZK3_9HELO